MSREYTRESVERALASHADAGRISSWSRTGDGRYVVTLNSRVAAFDLELSSLREAWILVAGLASTHYGTGVTT